MEHCARFDSGRWLLLLNKIKERSMQLWKAKR
nr:MAG TPA: hypothetical protein [Caudoviricetes sp.]